MERPSPIQMGTMLLFICLCGGWYIFFYKPLRAQVLTVRAQNEHLDKRTVSLKKRLTSGVQKTDKLLLLQEDLQKKRERFSVSCLQVSQALLEHINKNSLYLKSWNPGEPKDHEYLFSQPLSCELSGTFRHLYDFIATLPSSIILRSACIKRGSQELLLSGTFLLLFKECV